ncbi:MAG: hypothetical protein ACE5LU_06525 [Anaerolineae bacterium]
MRYTHLVRFLLPLILTVAIQELGGQVLNGGMARVPRATETLASYGLAWGLVSFLASPLSQVKQLGLVLVDGQYALKQVRLVVLIFGLSLAGILAGLALSPPGVWVIEELHGISHPLSNVVREALFWFIPIPVLRGLMLFYSGLLIRIRRTDVVSSAILAGMVASILAVFALLPVGFVQARPIWMPLLVTYAGVLAELAIVVWGYWRYVRHLLEDASHELPLAYVVRFFWPLALIMAVQGLSRPLINLFISRGSDGAEALAVLTVVYPLAHLPYGWLNEIRNLPPAFKDMGDNLTYIRRFTVGCGLVSFFVMVSLFWTPLRGYILETLIGIESELATRCRVPLLIFSFFPLVVMIRAYFHGMGLLQHRTRAMAPSAPARIGAILVTLTILSASGLHGATRGIAALLSGFVFETMVVRWGVRGGRIAVVHRNFKETY